METGNKYKRKRPKRRGINLFRRNAIGFGKQGIFGRGSHIDDEQFNYFINIMDAFKDLEDVEDRVNMANNVFEQTVGKETVLASNQVVSKALESLIVYVDDAQLERFFSKFGDNFRPMCSDKYASHVLQKILEVAFLRGLGQSAAIEDKETATKKAKADAAQLAEQYNLETKFTDAHREQCRQFVLRLSKFMLNNLEDFVWDSCASHIMRSSILLLVGLHVPKIIFAKGSVDLTKHGKLYTVPEEWHEVMKEFPQRLQMWPQFTDLPFQEQSSALLGVICLSLSVIDKSMLKHFAKKILNQCLLSSNQGNDDKKDAKIEIKDEEEQPGNSNETAQQEEQAEGQSELDSNLPMVFQYQSAVILLETMLSVAGEKLFVQLYAMLFSGRIARLAHHQQTNFAVQRLLQHISHVPDFEAVFTELQPNIEQLLKMGYTGVVSGLSAACLRLGTKQAQLIAALQAALHVTGNNDKSKKFFVCLVKLKPYELIDADDSRFVHLHGSLMAQHILQFNKPIFLVNCVLELPAPQLAQIFNTPNGSHIVDAFMESKFIGEKSRERLLRQLNGFYVDLAITRHGSRVLEVCFKAAQEPQKMLMAKELSSKANMVKSTPFGSIIFVKFHLDTYKTAPKQWLANLGKEQELPKASKKRAATASELFKDITS